MAHTPKPLILGGSALAGDPRYAATVTQTPTVTPTLNTTISHTLPVVQSATNNLPAVVLKMGDADKVGAQDGIASATKKVNDIAKLSDMDELGTLLGQTLSAAKGYDPSAADYKPAGIIGFFKRKVETARQRYESVDANVNRLIAEMDKRVAQMQSRVTDLSAIETQNMRYYDSLTKDIEHLNAGIAYMEANPPEVDPNDHFSAKKAQEWAAVIAWARLQADNLARAQLVAQSQDAQIMLMKQNSQAMATRFKDLQKTVLPLMQQSFALYIINREQEKNADFAEKVADAGDEALKKVAASLTTTTAKVHASLNRSNFSVEAITANHDAVIQCLNDIDRIRVETKNRLAAEAPILEQKSRELTNRLAQHPSY